MTDVLEVTVTERAVCARVNRPEVRNAWDREVAAALAAVLDHRRSGDAIAMGLQYEDADTAARIRAFLDRRRR